MNPLLMLILLLVLPVSMAGAQASQREAELAQVREHIQELKKAIDRDTRKRSTAQAALQESEQAIGAANRRLKALGGEQRASQARRSDLAAQRKVLAGEVGKEQEALAGQVRAAYMTGREERIKLMLNQEDPATLGRLMVYYDYLNRMRAETIRQVGEQLRQMRELDENLAAELRRLENLADQQREQLAKLETSREERGAALKQLDEQLADQGARMSELEEQAKVLEDLVRDLRAALKEFPVQSQEPFARLKGKMAWPLSGTLLADFGQPRAGKRIKWNGVLVSAARGTEVRAIYHGRVAYADWLPGMGLLVIIDHGDGYMSLYGHNDTLYIAAGDWVAPGDVVASVGDSGGRSEPALYFEIRQGTRPQNPHRWFGKRLSSR